MDTLYRPDLATWRSDEYIDTNSPWNTNIEGKIQQNIIK